MGRPAKTVRNAEIVYDATVEMLTVREIAEKYGISEPRVYQILKIQAQDDIDDDVHVAMHTLTLRKILKNALEIANSEPTPMFDVKGKPLYRPGTEIYLTDSSGNKVLDSQGHWIKIGGEPVPDNSSRIKALDTALKTERNLAALGGRDAPSKQQISITTEDRNNAQAALDALKTLVLEAPDLMRQAVIQSDMKAIEGQVES